MKIDLATERDVHAVLPMMEEFNRFEAIAWSRVEGEPVLRHLVEHGTAHVGLVGLVRKDEAGEPVGYFVLTWGYDLEWNGRDAFLTELFLLPSARGAGLGQAALAGIEDIAVAHGARALHLLVRHDNVVARRLYRRAGFGEPPRAFMTKRIGPRAP